MALGQYQIMSQVEPATDSIFLRVEAKLEQLEYQKAIKFLTRSRKADSYRSITDFLLCEAFPEFKPGCKRFYEGTGSQFKDLPEVNKTLIEIIDILLADGLLELCIISLHKERRKSWGNILKEFNILKQIDAP